MALPTVDTSRERPLWLRLLVDLLFAAAWAAEYVAWHLGFCRPWLGLPVFVAGGAHRVALYAIAVALDVGIVAATLVRQHRRFYTWGPVGIDRMRVRSAVAGVYAVRRDQVGVRVPERKARGSRMETARISRRSMLGGYAAHGCRSALLRPIAPLRDTLNVECAAIARECLLDDSHWRSCVCRRIHLQCCQPSLERNVNSELASNVGCGS
jgi:hypothetical protein